MIRYRFRLAAVRREREQQRDRAAGDLASALRADHEAVAAVGRRHAGYEARLPGAGPRPAGRLLVEAAVAGAAATALRAAEERRRATAAEADDRRAAWTAASQRVELLDALDRRRREAWQQDERRHEQTAVDELVTARRQPSAHGGGR